jgi:hypothetical protein
MELKEVGDFGDENCLPTMNKPRSAKFHLTIEPPIFVGAVMRWLSKEPLLLIQRQNSFHHNLHFLLLHYILMNLNNIFDHRVYQ